MEERKTMMNAETFSWTVRILVAVLIACTMVPVVLASNSNDTPLLNTNSTERLNAWNEILHDDVDRPPGNECECSSFWVIANASIARYYYKQLIFNDLQEAMIMDDSHISAGQNQEVSAPGQKPSHAALARSAGNALLLVGAMRAQAAADKNVPVSDDRMLARLENQLVSEVVADEFTNALTAAYEIENPGAQMFYESFGRWIERRRIERNDGN